MRFKKAPAKRKKCDVADSATAQAIFLAARACFMEKGYSGVTFREIAERAGVASSLISYYYDSKENLAAEVCSRFLDEVAEELGQTDFHNLASGERFYITVYMEWLKIDEVPAYSRFYYSYYENSLGQKVLNGSNYLKMVNDIIEEYGLLVSSAENTMYMIANRGATRELMLHHHKGQYGITREDVMDITTSNYFYNLGLDDEQIYSIVTRSKEFLTNYYGSDAYLR